MRTYKKHTNTIQPKPLYDESVYNYLRFCFTDCYGERKRILNNFKLSLLEKNDRENDNSYLFFEEDFTKTNNSKYIGILSRGEIFGIIGRVPESITDQILNILNNCEKYRLDFVNNAMLENDNLELILTWIDK